MKKTLVLLLLVVVATSIAAPAFAADADWWGIDSSHQTIGANPKPADAWAVDGDGVTDGMLRFTDWGMQALYFFGSFFKWRW